MRIDVATLTFYSALVCGNITCYVVILFIYVVNNMATYSRFCINQSSIWLHPNGYIKKITSQAFFLVLMMWIGVM